MAELVYAFDLKSNEETRAGSIPALGTNSGLFSKNSRVGANYQKKVLKWCDSMTSLEPILARNL